MKYVENIKSIADLNPDYLGFIFYDRSKRNFTGAIPELPKHIKKTKQQLHRTKQNIERLYRNKQC